MDHTVGIDKGGKDEGESSSDYTDDSDYYEQSDEESMPSSPGHNGMIIHWYIRSGCFDLLTSLTYPVYLLQQNIIITRGFFKDT